MRWAVLVRWEPCSVLNRETLESYWGFGLSWSLLFNWPIPRVLSILSYLVPLLLPTVGTTLVVRQLFVVGGFLQI
jgi:hypothetical protein